jgi:uncharacterized protein (DUF58 family)
MPEPAIRVERIRITRVGVWYIVVAIVVGAAATNTGNNALYLVESMLLALLAASGIASRRNLRRLELEFVTPPEAYAGRLFSVQFTLRCRDRFLARRYLLVSGLDEVQSLLVPYLGNRREHRNRLFFRFPKRGLFRIPYLRVSSIFPLGFFEKAMGYPAQLEILVFPEILPVSGAQYFDRGRSGEELSKKAGWSHELRALRLFRPGDDPRSIHWKRSARTGELVFMEREAEEGRRLSILFDNAAGDLSDREAEEQFEPLVTEAASVAVHYLEQGFEVALTTRDAEIPFGRGRVQKLNILKELALLKLRPLQPEPLWSGRPAATELRLGLVEESVAV